MTSLEPSDEELAELMSRWQAGWVSARGYLSSYEHGRNGDASITVQVGPPERHVKNIAVPASPSAYQALVRQAVATGQWLTVPSRDRAVTENLARDAGLDVLAPEWLMTRKLTDHPVAENPAEYTVVHSSRGDVQVVEVVTAEGLAAKGQIAVTGSDAVADRIFTMPDHRRRGLGRVVMGHLAVRAVDRGARTGLLIASADGRHLYERLGWQMVVEVVGARPASGGQAADGSAEPPADPLE